MINTLVHSLQAQLAHFEQTVQTGDTLYQHLSLEIPLPAPLLSLISIHSRINNSIFLSRPDADIARLGLGTLVSIKAQGENRLDIIKSRHTELLEHWYSAEGSESPTAFLAFAFDENDPMSGNWQDFPNMILTIPDIMIKQSGSTQTLTANIKVEKNTNIRPLKIIEDLLNQLVTAHSLAGNDASQQQFSTPLPAEQQLCSKKSWCTLAENAIKEIHSGKFNKLVTSRRYSLQSTAPVSTHRLLSNLVNYYPGCSIFSYRNTTSDAENTVIAASPERLVTLQNHTLQSDALGGTISRNTAMQDSSAAPFFLKHLLYQTESERSESQKLLKEHNYISRTIYQNLDPLCHSLTMPLSPNLMKLHHLYHLETPIKGKLMACYDLFDVIKALHPTPAIAGLPSQAARQWLLDNENYHRGWYTGAFGWLDSRGNGDLAVMLRCTLIRRKTDDSTQAVTQLDLFAGAGLVAESTPDAEWQETELKMKTILEML